MPGTLYNFNTLEKFHTLNKRELMKKEAEKVHRLECFITILMLLIINTDELFILFDNRSGMIYSQGVPWKIAHF